ncbi:hypothetical protein C8R45DRAFT_1085038 [Mycena sanguinolenta]|nr:hypothetical protein C8R45DRAFT_1085038 [Mycena sanguinolenta]
MSTLSETSLSLLSQSNSTSPPWTFSITGVLFSISVAAAAFYHAFPTRLTRVLVSTLADVENAYLAGVENGFALSADVDVAKRLAVFQLTVSTLRETSLHNSLSPLAFLSDTLNIRRFIAVLRYLAGVRGLGTYIEVMQSYKSLLRLCLIKTTRTKKSNWTTLTDLLRIPTLRNRLRVALSVPTRESRFHFPASARLSSFVVNLSYRIAIAGPVVTLSFLCISCYADSAFPFMGRYVDSEFGL